MRHPRILMLSGNAPPVMDGVGDCTDRLIEELARQRPNWRWFWLCRRPRWFHSPLVFRRGVTLVRPSHSWSPRGRGLACAAVRAIGPDVVHVQDQIHSFHETDAACRIADATDRPVVTTLHEYHVELPSVRITNALVKRSTVIIANDPRNAERCREQMGRNADHLWWSGNTVSPPESGSPPRTVAGRLTTFGFLSAIKSVELVHDAIRSLRPSHPDLHWRIIGPFQPVSNPHHASLARQLSS